VVERPAGVGERFGDPQYYNDHIQVAGPYCSIVAGIPLMFLAGWWVAGWWRQALGVRAAWIVWLAYALIDLAILLAAGMSVGVGLLFVVSFATKLAAVHFGAGSGSHDRPNQTLQQRAGACRLSQLRGPSSPVAAELDR
jgi:hypothetical protein